MLIPAFSKYHYRVTVTFMIKGKIVVRNLIFAQPLGVLNKFVAGVDGRPLSYLEHDIVT